MTELVASRLNTNRSSELFIKNDPNEELLMIHDEAKESDVSIAIDEENNFQIADPLANLPDNWAQLDFERKKSCLLSHVYSTCVNKAISHLESLQNAIDDWMVRAANERTTSSRVADLVRTRQNASPARKLELKFSLPPVHSFTSKLEVRGAGTVEPKKGKAADMVIEARPSPSDDLRADGVLEEVLIILARLEYDRRRTEAHLAQEKQNVIVLKDRIEKWALKRITDLPIMVQREHEACVTDITELHWHIAFNSKSEQRLAHKVEVEEKFCVQLQEDIDNINKSTPLIEEKISLELKAIQKILQAQQETDELLMKAREKYNDAFDRNKVAHSKASKEIEALNADLADSKRELNKAKKRLLEANEASRNLQRNFEDSSKELSDNMKQEYAESERRDANKIKNVDLQKEYAHIENERFRIKKESDNILYDNQGLQNKITLLTKQYNDELTQLTDVLTKKEEKLEKIMKKITEKRINIEDMERDKAGLIANIQKEERHKERLLKDKEKNDQQLTGINDSYVRALQLNESVVGDLSKEKTRFESREENMRRQIHDVKKQVLEEKHQFQTLTARLQNEVEEFQNFIIDTRLKKQQFEVRKEELELRLADLGKTVGAGEMRRGAVEERIGVLKKDLTTTKSNHQQLETELSSKIKRLEPVKVSKTKEFEQNSKILSEMKTHTAQMEKKINEMEESKLVMAKTIEKAKDEIDDLNDIVEEFNIQHKSAENLDKQMQAALSEIVERNKQTEMAHIDHSRDRRAYLNDLEKNLKLALDENKELASKYRQFKYDMYMKKLQYLLKIEKSLDVFSKVKDKRQLQVLQVRMHNALEDYFNFQVEFGEYNYGKLNLEVYKNSEKIAVLEDSFHESVDRITDFLKNQMDFSLVRQQAMQKVQKEELEEQYKQGKTATSINNSKQTKPKVNFKLESVVH